jgi:hypothetical protein
MWRCMNLVRTNVRLEIFASIFRVERICKVGTMLEITSSLNLGMKNTNYMRKGTGMWAT